LTRNIGDGLSLAPLLRGVCLPLFFPVEVEGKKRKKKVEADIAKPLFFPFAS
jgi:hypothetical protein